MIGDNPEADLAGAAAAGMPGMLVRRPLPPGVRGYPDLAALVAALLPDG